MKIFAPRPCPTPAPGAPVSEPAGLDTTKRAGSETGAASKLSADTIKSLGWSRIRLGPLGGGVRGGEAVLQLEGVGNVGRAQNIVMAASGRGPGQPGRWSSDGYPEARLRADQANPLRFGAILLAGTGRDHGIKGMQAHSQS